MAEEKSRTRSVRRITAPGDTGTYIDLKIIDDITFKDDKPPYQEWVLKFQNNPDDAARTVRVVEVGDAKLKVERIDTLDTEESTGRRQESIWSFLNDKDPPVHLETHETTIYASDGNGNITDTGTWIKVQRIDKIEFEDEADEVRNQESVWQLDNPDKSDDKDDYKELTPPVRTWDNSTINPPWRLDPFQTITDCSFGRYMLIFHSNNKIAAIPMSRIKEPIGNVKTNKTSATTWNSYGFGTQLKLSQNAHVAILSGLQINADGSIVYNLSGLERYRYHIYNSKNSILGSVQAPDADAAPFSIIFNGTSSKLYDDRGRTYDISTDGVITYSSRVSGWRNNGIGYPTSNGTWYGPTSDTNYAINSRLGSVGEAGIYTDAQYALKKPTVPGTFDYWSWGGPEPTTLNDQWEDDWSQPDHIAVYSNDGTLDKVEIKTVTITATFASEDAGSGLTYRYGSYSYGSLMGSFAQLFGFNTATFTYVSESTISGQSFFQAGSTLHLGTNPTSEMFIAYIEGESSGTSGSPFDTPTISSSYPPTVYNIAANGKNILYHYYLETGIYKLNIDRTDYTEAYKSALGLSDLKDINFILFDVKKSDIEKLK